MAAKKIQPTNPTVAPSQAKKGDDKDQRPQDRGRQQQTPQDRGRQQVELNRPCRPRPGSPT